MARASPHGLHGPTRRSTLIAASLAVVAHVGIIALLGKRPADARGRLPPSVEGMSAGEAMVGGMPVSKERNQHMFRVLDFENSAPLAFARVTDVLGDLSTVTGPQGTVVLITRPGARLVVQVEKPGYAMHSAQYENNSNDPVTHSVFLDRKPVPYAAVDTIFIGNCNYCHGAFGKTEGIDLTSFDRVMQSRTRSGPIVVPFNPDSSRLIRVLLDSTAAPPRSAHGRLTARPDAFDIETIVEWIREGARATPPPR